jgi:hypothetical protein
LNDTNTSTRLSRLTQTYWAEQVLQPARPSDFHTAIFKAQSHHTIMRAAMLGLPSLFDKQAQTQRRNGRELISLLHYHLSVSQTLRFVVSGCWIYEESRRRKPSEEGERE